MKIRILLTLLLATFTFQAKAEEQGFISQEERYRTGAWNWIPSGGSQKTLNANEDDSCDPRRLSQALLSSVNTPRGQVEVAREYMARCRKPLGKTIDSALTWFAMGAEAQVAYDYTHHRNVRYIEIPNPDGLLIRARLALKPGNDARPLIIVKCGIHCNLGSPSLKITLMVLHDEGPFHVLLLPSVTGSDWETDNNSVVIGGLDEGRQIFNVARYLQSPAFEFSKRISAVHVVGFSLGGHATLYSALYSDNNPRPDGSRYIRSVFAGCPAVDLEASVRRLYTRTPVGYLLSERLWSQILQVGRFTPGLGQILPNPSQRPSMDKYPGILERASFEYYREVTRDATWALAPFQNMRMEQSQDIWKYNSLPSYFDRMTKTPVFVWSSRDDQVVLPSMNSDLMADYADEHPESPFQVMTTPQGAHCAFLEMFGWRTASEAIRGYFLSRSPELLERREFHRVPLEFRGSAPKLASYERIHRLEWLVAKDQDTAELYVQIRAPLCPPSPIQGASMIQPCTRHYTVPLSVFGLKPSDTPANKGEAESLTRWLNGNVVVSGEQAGRLGNREVPAQVEWTSYDAK